MLLFFFIYNIKMSEQAFEYLDKHNLSNNEFIISLKKSIKKYGKLTPNQEKALLNKVEDHKRTERLLNSCESDAEIIHSLRDFFASRGFLTKKQIEMLEKFS